MGSCCGRASIQVQNITTEEMKYMQLQAINMKAKAPELKLNSNNLYKKRKNDQSNDNSRNQTVTEEETKAEQKKEQNNQQAIEHTKSKSRVKPLNEQHSISTSKLPNTNVQNGIKIKSQRSKEQNPSKNTIRNSDSIEEKNNKKMQELSKIKM